MSERAVGAAGSPENNAPPNLQLRDLLERAWKTRSLAPPFKW